MELSKVIFSLSCQQCSRGNVQGTQLGVQGLWSTAEIGAGWSLLHAGNHAGLAEDRAI